MNWNRLAPGVIAILVLIDGGLYIHHGTVNKKLPSVRSEYAQLKRSVGSQKHQMKHPVIRKTIPSAYKKMMDDGHQVQNAENKLINMAYKGHGKLNHKSSAFQKAHNVLQQYVSSTGSTDDDVTNNVWTDHLKDEIRLIPGEGEAGGQYECAFIVSDAKGNIDNVITSTYLSDSHIFTNFVVYGKYNVTSNGDKTPVKKTKKSKKNVKGKHMNKKQAKKIIKRHNQPKRKGGAKK